MCRAFINEDRGLWQAAEQFCSFLSKVCCFTLSNDKKGCLISQARRKRLETMGRGSVTFCMEAARVTVLRCIRIRSEQRGISAININCII